MFFVYLFIFLWDFKTFLILALEVAQNKANLNKKKPYFIALLFCGFFGGGRGVCFQFDILLWIWKSYEVVFKLIF